MDPGNPQPQDPPAELLDPGAAAPPPAEGLLQLPTVEHAPGDTPGRTSGLTSPGDQAVHERPGSRIGRYKLLQLIGEGGFGTVFMAEQEHPVRRRVALKIVKLGMDTRQVVARFEAERQALAMMDHPNIARVLDAGATDAGRPYFVMELVKGVPITDYCDLSRLDTRQRLALFVQVCRAVQHAHQKGVIHRDLKPTNILVTLHDGTPVPKVIDFGIAKAMQGRLTDRTLFTEFRQLVGTPAYMSPEQAEMSSLDVDTRSDVYSLGVLLYELLTGTTPFDPRDLKQATYADMQRLIREVEPQKPSTRLSSLGETLTTVAAKRGTESRRLVQSLKGELDWIVMKCLEKDRTRRYDTAIGLASDVERYLNDEAVTAGPPSRVYRVRKLAARNKGPLAAAAAVVGALVLGLGAATFGLVRANIDREKLAKSQATEASLRSAEHAAKQDALDKLWDASLAMAQAGRWSGKVGRRFESLKAIAQAAKIRPDPRLRDEAIACMALADLQLVRRWDIDSRSEYSAFATFDAALERYAVGTDAKGTVSVRRVRDDAELARLPGPGLRVGWFFAFSPSGRYLGVKYDGEGSMLKVWDVSRTPPAEVLTVPGRPNAEAANFTPDSAAIGVADRDGKVWMYDLPSGRDAGELLTGDDRVRVSSIPDPRVLRFNPRGGEVALAGLNKVQFRRFRPNPPPQRPDPTGVVTHTLPGVIHGIAWHPDGERVAAACGDLRAYVIQARGVQRVSTELHQSEAIRADVSADGALLATGAWDHVLRLWDPQTGKPVVQALGFGSFLRFDVTGRHLVAAGPTQAALWRVSERAEYLKLNTPKWAGKGPRGVDFSPDGRLVAGIGDSGTAVWDAETGAFLGQLNVRGESIVFEPDGGHLLASGPRGLQRWPIRIESAAHGPGPEAKPDVIRFGPPQQTGVGGGRICLTPDARRLFANTPGGLLAALDPADVGAPGSEEKARLGGVHPRLTTLAVSPDGRWVATGAWQGAGVMIWEAGGEGAPRLVARLPADIGDAHVAFSPDNRWLATGEEKEVRFWEVGTWKFRHRATRNVAGGMPGLVAFAPDGRCAAISQSNFVVKLIDPDTGADLATLESPEPQYLSWLCFSRDGSKLAAATENQVVQLWDLHRIRRALRSMHAGLDWHAAAPPAAPDPGAGDRQRPPAVVAEGGAGDGRLVNKPPSLPDAIRLYADALAVHPDNAVLLATRGRLLARALRLKEAAGHVDRAVRLDPADHYLAYQGACLHLFVGDAAGHRRHCEALLAAVGKPETLVGDRVNVAERTAKACLLGAQPVGDPAVVARLIDRALEVGEPKIYVPWYQMVKGLAEYRAGHYDEAAKYLEQSRQLLPASPAKATADLLLAMAHHKAGRPDAARAAAEISRTRFEGSQADPPPTAPPATAPSGEAGQPPFELDSSFENWLIYWIVLREAEQTLGPLMPKASSATKPAGTTGA